MNRIMNIFGGIAGLVVAAAVAVLLFTLLGSLLIVGGVLLVALVLGGGVYALLTGRMPGMGRGGFSVVRVYDVRTGRPFEDAPSEGGMIDITPPKGPKPPHASRPDAGRS